jgi:transposase
MIDAARMVKHHWAGVLRWFDSKINNGILEGLNNLVQAAKAKVVAIEPSRTSKR